MSKLYTIDGAISSIPKPINSASTFVMKAQGVDYIPFLRPSENRRGWLYLLTRTSQREYTSNAKSLPLVSSQPTINSTKLPPS